MLLIKDKLILFENKLNNNMEEKILSLEKKIEDLIKVLQK